MNYCLIHLLSEERDLPDRIVSDQVGTWSYDTMSRRIWKDIFSRIVVENSEVIASNDVIKENLEEVEESLSKGRDGYLKNICDNEEDFGLWNTLLSEIPDSKRNWLDAPWLTAEFYFYRKIVESFQFFHQQHDMFSVQKFSGLKDSLPIIEELASKLCEKTFYDNQYLALEVAVYTSLWGNKLDLSLWPKTVKNASHAEITSDTTSMVSSNNQFQQLKQFILDDHSTNLLNYLQTLPNNKQDVIIDIIVDNAGYELVSDFVLAYILLRCNIASIVRFHTKGYPTFVSDATTLDCLKTISYLQSLTDSHVSTVWWAGELQQYVHHNRIQFRADNYWCQPLPFWTLPQSIYTLFQESSLVFIKGDANYRRALGDRKWSLQTPAAHILRYWPAPVCTLRVLKAEIGCGIGAEIEQKASEKDAKWLVSGKWAVIQFVIANHHSNINDL